MIDYAVLTLADKSWINEILRKANFNSEEYNFTFMFIWRDIFQYKAARINDFLVLKADRSMPTYLYPAGSGDVLPVLEAMREDAAGDGHNFVFHAVLAEQKALLETLYPDKFEFTPLTDYFDYVYDAQSLITLKGKKLHSKRNHINRFAENYPDWSFECITPENMPEVIEMSREWCRINECEKERSSRNEACAVEEAIRHYEGLELDGGLIRAGGRVIAFSMGDRLNNDTYIVHIEKAYGDIQGAYAIMNQRFAAKNCADYLYINREDDSGDEGLRKAKLSYGPVLMVEKYAAKWKI